MSKLYIAIGVPGSGKSTYLKTLDAVYVSSDAIREELFGDEDSQENPRKVFAILNSRIKKALKEGKDAIYDATNVAKGTRKSIIKDYREMADEIIAYFVDTQLEIAIQRNNNRDRVVPVEVIERMNNKLSPPTIEEGFDKIVHIKTELVNGKEVTTKEIITE